MSTDGQNVTLETGERAGRVDASTAIAKVAMCAGLTANPTLEKLGPIRLLDVPGEKPIPRLCGVAEGQTGESMLQTGDHRTVSDLNLESHRFGWALDEAKQLGPSRLDTSKMLDPECQNLAT
jgi:hypothetical protein